ncbi:hypothetical protein IFM60648_10146 [Aspergillus lentulus]|uniref:Alpha-L-rhamnosidase C-terminal domain-containing protein n=1 Tax=Aspergillus lentulus TaxID=293939 RepID=A0ABQ1B785_ASPLE|nr:hypothetical protein IFM60648_10146 [Aspergillus lentulus]
MLKNMAMHHPKAGICNPYTPRSPTWRRKKSHLASVRVQNRRVPRYWICAIQALLIHRQVVGVDLGFAELIVRFDSKKRKALDLWQWFRTPLGTLITLYGLNVLAWGGMLFLLLCNAAPAMCDPSCNDPDSPRRKWIEIDSQILNALFCIPGLGLAPWRMRGLYLWIRWRVGKDDAAFARLRRNGGCLRRHAPDVENELAGVVQCFEHGVPGLLSSLDTVPSTGGVSTRTFLSSMARSLFISAGALAFSHNSAASGWSQKVSPYASGYHLQAALHTRNAATATYLLHTLWGSISDPAHGNYTGCTWETLDTSGRPGLGAPTSLCHAWGSAPTAELSRHVLGIRAATPGFRRWKVEPVTLGLQWARGRHPVPGGVIQVDWSFDRDGLLTMTVNAPVDTNGTVLLPRPLQVLLKRYQVSGAVRKVGDGAFAVQGGRLLPSARRGCQENPRQTLRPRHDSCIFQFGLYIKGALSPLVRKWMIYSVRTYICPGYPGQPSVPAVLGSDGVFMERLWIRVEGLMVAYQLR